MFDPVAPIRCLCDGCDTAGLVISGRCGHHGGRLLGQRERETTNEDTAFTAPGQDGDDARLSMRLLDAPLVADPGFQQHFPDEVEALRGLDEPWLVVPAGVVADAAGYVTAVTSRSVTGPRLAALLDRHPRGLDTQSATVIAMDVLSALSALHERRVAHRGDLAEHVVVADDGTCVVVDAGLAPRPESETLHEAIAADLRSFADLLMRCLSGESDGLGAVLEARSTHRLTDAPEPLESIAARAAAREPGPQTAAALLTDVAQSAARQFDADWDARTRERLVQLTRSLAEAQPAGRDARPAAVRSRSVSLVAVVTAAVAVLGGATGFSLVILSRPHSTPAGSPPTIYWALNTVPSASAAGTASASADATLGASPSAPPTVTAQPSSAGPSASATTKASASSSPPPARTPTSYEGDASSNILAGGARAATCTGCPDGQKIRFIGNGGTLTFPDVSVPSAGDYTLVITYVDGDSGRDAIVSVNGSAVLGIHFPGTGGWNSTQTFSAPVHLDSGLNSIEFSNPNTWAPDIAEITV
jgi:tRNA A-37 threonylcarbamoyl transferase component Bud32